MTMSAGHLIVKTLEAHGVERVFAVPGESYLDVLDGLHDSPIKTVVTRHEGGAGFMALTEGRLSSTPGIAMVTRGPGAANAMIAIHTAWQDATALVLFVGLIPLSDRGRGAFQEFSLEGWFSTTSKAVYQLDDENQAGQVVARALRLASSGRPGPVIVGLPEDVLVRLTSSPVPTPQPLPTAAPDSESLSIIMSLIAGADRPAIVVGGDGWDANSSATLGEFAVAARIPLFADWRAYDAVDHDCDAYAGWLGYGRSDHAAVALGEADLLVFLGCSRTDVLSEGYTSAMNTPTVVVTPDASLEGHAGRLDIHVGVSPMSFISALPSADSVRGKREATWMQRLRTEQVAFARPGRDGGVGVDLAAAFETLEEVLDSNRIISYGAGNATLWGHRYLSHHGPGTLVGPRNGAMGLAVPAAVAASISNPGRQVVAICGDGDFFMNAQELAVAFAQGASPIVIVVDNGVYGTIVQHQELNYPGRPSGTGMVNPNFARWIEAFSGHGEYVDQTEDFAPALRRALAHGGPALLHLKTDPETMGPGTAAHSQEISA
ncbi:thiamine pyrophosphate-dependent enzyme [Glutamicibacter protophormiae]|uniref:Acetolactate synthase-1/2/3 large subunit n=1 Tax=Glutamicibacter protophormiae TaxID=37930 RepID=A0ABS4XLX2_GLUPR|nr:thiamine pyrophosphate-dependent enzyme [Glutamicibacter protophormiae]MBP2397502.1 acetolactate synthase-1/2/3 large subunit [Glutamicibacter protophormiae]GGL78735.1 thiamine pyrophosphate protein [Glutamicibacter protophormiae]